jgi:hypothetical protein
MYSRLWVAAALLFGACERDININADKDPSIPTDTDIGAGVDPTNPDGDGTSTGGPDDDAVSPVLSVSPRFLDFGLHAPGTRVDDVVTIRNDGEAALQISGMALAGSNAFELSSDADLSIDPGASVEVTVSFTASPQLDEGELSFLSNDSGLPSVTVGLEGTGAAARLEIDTLDFGYVLVDTVSTQPWVVRNTGNAAARITAVTSTDSHFTVALPQPVDIDPGSSATLDVRFRPDDIIPFNTSLDIVSDAYDAPAPTAAQGHGADVPVAMCWADPGQVVAIHETFSWVGHDSYDPVGRPLTGATWTLVSQPQGSSYTIGGTGVDRLNQTADAVGDYVAELVVTNDLGLSSEPCQATLEARPNADLWVETFWDAVDDIDLHLLRGNAQYTSPGDCYYDNCIGSGLPWGQVGNHDDPFLDLDDIRGLGPENINIATPASNTFRVVLHDFPATSRQARTNATVKVYVYGTLSYTRTVSFTGEGVYREVALVDWTASPPTVTDL